MGLRTLLDGLRHRIAIRHWKRHLSRIEHLDPKDAAIAERRARQLQRITGQVIAASVARSVSKTIDRDGDHGRHTWTFRPPLWLSPIFPARFVQPATKTELCRGVTLYHDDPNNSLNASQMQASSAQSVAPLAFAIETHGFTGQFVSLALDLPKTAWQGLSKSELIGLELRIDVSRPCKVFGRANVRHGPNTDELLREIDLSRAADRVAFELLFSSIEIEKVSSIWVDVIIEDPKDCQIMIHDCVVTRHQRANV